MTDLGPTGVDADRRRLEIRRFQGRVPIESIASILTLLAIWQFFVPRTEDYILPPIPVVVQRVIDIFTDSALLWNVVLSVGRICAGLIGAFLIGTVLGLAMGASKRIDGFFMPPLQITQGIPSLSWVVVAIIWFQTIEPRIFFILLMVTLPGFAFQAQDSYRAIPKELRDMARSLRPRRLDMLRTVTLPAIIPGLLTAWKVALGLGTRVVLIAELVGAPVGVGFQLLQAQQQFSMASVIAWTGVLVLFVLAIQRVITLIERRLLRYRPRAADDPDNGSDSRARKRFRQIV